MVGLTKASPPAASRPTLWKAAGVLHRQALGDRFGAVKSEGSSVQFTPRASEVLLLAEEVEVRDAVSAAAAALEVRLRTVTLADVAAHWRRASVVFVGQRSAAGLADLGLGRRPGVYLVGSDPEELGRWSMPVGAGVVPLPEGRAWLTSLLAQGGAGSAPVVTVVGGSGGLGASTLAAALACRAARRGVNVVLIDLDGLGGGLDLLLGAEAAAGWRWPRLAAAAGFVGDLTAHLPSVDGVSLLSMPRGEGVDVAREPLTAVVGSLQRSHDLVIIDPGRALGVALRDSVQLATSLLFIVGTALRSLAASQELADRLDLADAGLVVRRLPGGSLPTAAVRDGLSLRLAAVLDDDSSLRAAAEFGDAPLGRRRFAKTCDALLAEILPGGSE